MKVHADCPFHGMGNTMGSGDADLRGDSRIELEDDGGHVAIVGAHEGRLRAAKPPVAIGSKGGAHEGVLRARKAVCLKSAGAMHRLVRRRTSVWDGAPSTLCCAVPT